MRYWSFTKTSWETSSGGRQATVPDDWIGITLEQRRSVLRVALVKSGYRNVTAFERTVGYLDTIWAALASFRIAKNNRSKSACTLNQRKRLNNQAVWPVIFGITGPICARAPKPNIQREFWGREGITIGQ